VRADMSGYVSELLANAVSQAALDQPVTKADRDALIGYLKRAGGLDARGATREPHGVASRLRPVQQGRGVLGPEVRKAAFPLLFEPIAACISPATTSVT
jgi:hypothetical protein